MPMNPRLLRPKALGVPVFSEQGYTRLWAVTNKSGAVTGSASTDSGQYAVKWWDGTTDVYDSGDPFTKSGSGTRAFEIAPVVISETSLLLTLNGSNGAVSTTDASSYGHAITFNGDAEISTTQSKFGGSALYLDGTGDYLSFTQNGAMDFGSEDFTVEAWLYIVGSGEQTVLSSGYPNGLSLYARTPGGNIDVAGNPGSGWTGATIGTAPPQNQWVHMAWVRDGGVLTVYVDGVSIGQTSVFASTQAGDAEVWIGAQAAPSVSAPFEGYIDDIRIVKGKALYTANFTPPTAQLSVYGPETTYSGQLTGFDVSDNSLVQLRAEDVALNSSAPSGGYNTGYYPYYNWIPYVPGSTEQGDLSENELSAVALDQFYTDLDSGTGDLFVQGNPGIVDDDPTIATGKGYAVFGSVPPSTTLLLHFDGSNGATSTTDDSPEGHAITLNGDAEISTAQSKFGGSSLLLNGQSHVSAAYDASLDLNSGDFTVEAWYRPASTGGFQSVVSVWDGGSGNASYILGVDGGTPTVYWGTDVNTPAVSGGTVNTGQWHHLALTRSGATMRLFCDGILEDSATVTDAASGIVGLTIGKYNITSGGAGAADGYIDDIRIIKGHALYTANFTPPTAELGVWYP